MMQKLTFILFFVIFTLNFLFSQTNWTGVNSSDWNDAGNWSAGVPNIGVNATIPAGCPNFPIITAGTANVRSLAVNNGASLSMTGGTLNVGLNFVKATTGILDCSGGIIRFVGNTNQAITGTISFYNVEIANTGTNPNNLVFINNETTIENDLILTSGRFAPGSGTASNSINIGGNWISNGATYVPNFGTVIFYGDFDRQIQGTSPNATTFYDLVV
ncbi:MAG: hypothetical protein NZ108_10550, partial [Bacteroidia bacterium]|nr:hypothetical protein [Bacteroidia bacterium]